MALTGNKFKWDEIAPATVYIYICIIKTIYILYV